MSGRYLDSTAQLLAHPNIERLPFAGWYSNISIAGDSSRTWRMRDTGSPLDRIWNRHWNTPPEHHYWFYEQLLHGNFDAIYQLGWGTGWNLGELYLALYAAPRDRVAFFVLSSRRGRQMGVDTGWRPIEVRGERYDYAVSRFNRSVY